MDGRYKEVEVGRGWRRLEVDGEEGCRIAEGLVEVATTVAS